MSFQYNLSALVQGRFRRIDLRQNILTWNIFIYHTVNRLNLTKNLRQSAVQVLSIHTLSHVFTSIYHKGYMYIISVTGLIVKFTPLSSHGYSHP